MNKEPRLAVLIADITNTRVCKIGYALTSLGWETLLLHRDALALENPGIAFAKTIPYRSAAEALSLARQLSPTIFHVFSCWNFEVAAGLIKEKPGIVVFDDYDVMAGMVNEPFAQSRYPGQLELERFCLEHADGVCCRSLELQYAKHHYGYRIKGSLIFFQDYCWDDPDLISKSIPRDPSGAIHIVHCGNLAAEKQFPTLRRRNGFFLELARNLCQSGIHFHIYPSPIYSDSLEEKFSEHLELAQQTPFFHFHRSISPDRLIGEMSRYDLGLQSSWRDGWTDEAYLPEKYTYATANKIFDYFDAGLGVVVDERLFQRRLVRRVNGGIVTYFDDLVERLHALPETFWQSMRSNAVKARQTYSMRRHVHRLVDFYESLLGPTSAKRLFYLQPQGGKSKETAGSVASHERMSRRNFAGAPFVGPYERNGIAIGIAEEQWLWRHREMIRGVVLDMSTPRYWHEYLYNLPAVAKVLISDYDHQEVGKLGQSSRVDIIGDFCASPPPLTPRSVDTVLCLSILEHCADPTAMVKNLAAILTDGGTAFILAPFAYIDGHLEPDYWRFGRDGLRLLANRAGLEIVEEGSFGDMGGYFREEFGVDASARNGHRGVPYVTWIICRRPGVCLETVPTPIKLYAGDLPALPEYNGWLGLSLTQQDNSHMKHDITQPLPFADNSVDAFQAEDVFEHIAYAHLAPILNEIHRVLKVGATFRLSVPDYRCDVLYERSEKDPHGNLLFDPLGGGSRAEPGHVWFPRYESVRRLIDNSLFATQGTVTFLHYYDTHGEGVTHRIDYARGHVQRTPDFDRRVQHPYRPMSLVVDLTKGVSPTMTAQIPVTSVPPRNAASVKLSFVMIVLNGMPFIAPTLEAIYESAHEIIIVEGAVENCMFAAHPDGSSTDGTVEFIRSFPDPEQKIILIQGKWPEKCEMQNEALRYLSGDYVWLVDSDEVYKGKDIETIRAILRDDPSIAQVNFIPDNFWKGFDYLFVHPWFFEPAYHYRRLFKFKAGARFISHRPPTMVWPGSDRTTEQAHVLDGATTRSMGIYPYHYSYVLESQVRQKIELYRRYGWGEEWHIDLEEWHRECYRGWTPENRTLIEQRYPVWTGGAGSYTVRFDQEHPDVMASLIASFNPRTGACASRPSMDGASGVEPRIIPETAVLPVIGNRRSLNNTLRSWELIDLDSPLKARYDTITTSLADGRPFWNIHVCLAFLAEKLNPASYLEVGVRTGGSTVQVLGVCRPEQVIAIDLWDGCYSSLPNQLDYTRRQLRTFQERTGKIVPIQFIQGDSHVHLKELIRAGRKFDLITIDGDHSLEGAREDLEDAVQLLADRGAIVFDDIIHVSFPFLLDLAYEIRARFPYFTLLLNTTQDNGCAVLLKNITWESLVIEPTAVRSGIKVAGDVQGEHDLTAVGSESEFASTIRELFTAIRPTRIIETGTYHGTGTTTVIAGTLRDLGLNDSVFCSIECNPANHEQARANLARSGLIGRVNLLHGLSVPRSRLPTMEEIEASCVKEIEFDDIFVDHKEQERALLYYKETDYSGAPEDMLGKALEIYDDCPDFVLLDSGGHMGHVEFSYLVARLKGPCYLALDDIFHIKHQKSYRRMQEDPRFKILIVSNEKFGFCLAKFTPSLHGSIREGQHLVWLRTDSIGDAVLSAAMLPRIRDHYAASRITVICQEHLAEYYEPCPFVDDVITFDQRRAARDQAYLDTLLRRIRELRADLLLNSVYSRSQLTDLLALGSGARETVALDGDTSNMDDAMRLRHNRLYSRIIPSPGEQKGELERHRDFLDGLGISGELTPSVWITPDDMAWAENIFEENDLIPEKTIALFAGAQYAVRHYEGYGDALAPICRDFDYSVIALGCSDDIAISRRNLDRIGRRTLNLCGETTLRQSAALISRCKIAVGAETGLAHIACATQTPNVALLGGGHFGRFMPYSPLTTIACLPLECYGCNWRCRYSRSHCVTDLQPGVVERAVRMALAPEGERIVVQPRLEWTGGPSLPAWKECGHLLSPIFLGSGPEENRSHTGPFLVSAIVSTYKSEKFIQGCLDDLVSQTLFRKGQLQVVVVNSGSPENEESIITEYLKRFPESFIYLLTVERESLYKAWNRGIKAASGKYLANANTDDAHRRDALEIMAATLENRPDIALVYADQIYTDSPHETFASTGSRIRRVWAEYTPQTLRSHCMVSSQPMWRADLHGRHGYFDETYLSAGDWEFWLRISERGERFLKIDDVMGLYYSNPNGIEHSNPAGRYEAELIKRRYNILPEEESCSDFRLLETAPTTPPCKISVVIPCYNYGHYLKDAVESVLAQSRRDFEIIIVDDASTDTSCTVAHELITAHPGERIRLIELKQNSGTPAIPRNTGISAATGSLILPLDPDDRLEAGFLAKTVALLDAEPTVSVAYTHIRHFGERHDTWTCGPFDPHTLSRNNVIPYCALFRKELWEKVGGYRSDVGYEDWHFWLDACEQGFTGKLIPEPLFLYRKHGGGRLQQDNTKQERLFAEIVNRHPRLYSSEERATSATVLSRADGSSLKRRVLIACTHFWPSTGGIETIVANLGVNLLQRGYLVDVATIEHSGRTCNEYLGITILSLQRTMHAGNNPTWKLQLRQLVTSGAYEACILISNPMTELIWSMYQARIPAHTKLIVQPVINVDDYTTWRDNKEFRGQLTQLLKGATAVITLTQRGSDALFMAEEGITSYFLPNAVTPLAADFDFRRKFGIAPDCFMLLHVANLYKVKNHIGLLRALRDLPDDCRLVMIGHPDGEQDYIEAFKRELRLHPKVVYIQGLTSNGIAAAMAAADLVVLSSDGEVSPVCILEAMGHGKPWLARPTCGTVNEQAGGIVTELDNFLTTVLTLRNNRNLLDQLGQTGFRHWQMCYSWDRVISGWQELLDRGGMHSRFDMPEELANSIATLRKQVNISMQKTVSYQTSPQQFRVIALISAYNEGDVIRHVIGDLIQQGVNVYLINNCSTDNTVAEASTWLGKGLLHIENFPQDAGYPEASKDQYIWRHILRRKEELAAELEADWFIHSDADEFRESPWPGLTLKQAIQVADRMGYNALDFELLNFRPINNNFIPGADVREALRYYEGSEEFNTSQIKAWKNLHLPVSIFRNGGHDITFPERSVCPVKFLLRHYPIRSQAHGEQKVFQERKNRFNSEERNVGWHIQYDMARDKRHNFLYDRASLIPYDGDQARLGLLSAQARTLATELADDDAMAADRPALTATSVAAPPETMATDSLSHLIERANARAGEGKTEEALRLYNEALSIDPGNYRALVGTGVVTLLQGNHSKASLSFSKALRVVPDDSKALCGLGMARCGQGSPSVGFELFKKALDADPENMTALAELARCAYRLNRHGEAAAYLQRYLMYHPGDKDMLFSLAGLLYKAGEPAKAQEQLERLLTLYPDYEGAREFLDKMEREANVSEAGSAAAARHAKRGLRFKEAGDHAAALEAFTHAYDLGDQAALVEIGGCLARLGRFDEAIVHYKQALQHDENNIRALIGLGVACLMTERQLQAVTWFNKALKIDPADSQALTGLGMARARQNKLKEAFTLFSSALAGDAENLAALTELLRIAYECDRLAEAEPFLRNYLMYHPADNNILYSLAGLLYRTGKLAEACDTLERVLVLDPEYDGGRELEELISKAISAEERT